MANKLKNFNPNSVATHDSNIFGLPFDEQSSELIIVPVPWEATVSYGCGTSNAIDQIFKASKQVDLFDNEYGDVWKKGIFMRPPNRQLLKESAELALLSAKVIQALEKNIDVLKNTTHLGALKKINHSCEKMNAFVYQSVKSLLQKNKKVILLGGDHSTPFGYYQALGERYHNFGILHFDAHCDLRKAYEHFNFSHASIMYNALETIPQIKQLTQVGIRDFCEEEYNYVQKNKNKIQIFYDKDVQYSKLKGLSWHETANHIVRSLPQKIHISFDVDALDAKFCPNTGTPVMGGLDIYEIFYMLQQIKNLKKEIVGIDFVEVGYHKTNEWNANVGARILFKLANFFLSFE